MATTEIILQSWHDGVKAAVETSWPPGAVAQLAIDQTLQTASPRAWNNVFAIAGDRAVPRKRDGCVTVNATPITGSAAIIGQRSYNYRDPTTGAISHFHVTVTEDGRLDWVSDSSGAVTTLDATAFTPGFYPPSFAVLNNSLFIANGLEPTKVYNGTVQGFGFARPTLLTTAVNAGVVGNLNGTYELAFTYYNSVSGHESSRSDATGEVVATSMKVDITGIPVPTDTQITTVYIYIRNTETQNQFYRIGSVVAGVTTATVDVDNGTEDVDLDIEAPSISENNPPPASIKYLAVHRNRLFAADETNLYWSKTGKPEAFDPNAADGVNANDGQRMTGIASLPGGMLIIFKEDGYYILEGDQPEIWTISRVGPAVGCVAAPSITLGADALYWWAEQGPVKLGFGALASPELIGHNAISAAISRQNLNFAERRRICATFDVTGQRILWALPEYGKSRNTRLVVWSSRLGCWESDRWDPLDAASLTTTSVPNEEPFVMIGGYAGQLFRVGVGTSDGVSSGTMTGTFVAATASHSTITVAAAAFLTTGGKLIERKVTVLDAAGTPMTTTTRPYITTNTGTVLTLSDPVGGLTVGSTYTVIVGGPDWQFETGWFDGDHAFYKKRLLFVYLLAMLNGQTLYVDLLRNRQGFTREEVRFASVVGVASLWNAFTWNDGTLWNDADVTYERIRGGTTGLAFGLRFRNPLPGQSVILLKTGMILEFGDDKMG